MNNQDLNLSLLASGVGVGLVGRFLGRIIAVVSGIYAARTLGPTIFGFYAIGLALIRLGEVFVPLGLDFGVIKYGAEWIESQRRFKGMILYSMLVSFGFGVVIGVITQFIPRFLMTSTLGQTNLQLVVRYVALVIPFIALLSIAASATRVSRDIRYSFATQDVGQPLVGLLLLAVFLSWQWGLEGVLLADLLSTIFILGLCLIFLLRLYPFILQTDLGPVPPSKNFYVFSITSSFSVIFTTLVFWVDRLILGAYLPPSDVGIYQAAAQVSVIFAVILSGMNRIIAPLFANLYSRADYDNLNEVYKIGTKWALYIGLPLFILLLAHPQSIIEEIYGSQYLNGATALSVLLIGQLINLLTGSVAPLLNVAGYQKHMMIFSAFALVLSIIINMALVPTLGILGSAIATSASLGVYYTSLLFFARRKLRAWPFDGRYIKIVLITLICLAIDVLFIQIIDKVSLFIIMAQLLALYGLSFLLLFLFGLDDEDRLVVRSIRKLLRR